MFAWTDPAIAGRAVITLVLAIAALWLVAYAIRLRRRMAKRLAQHQGAAPTGSAEVKIGRFTFWLLGLVILGAAAWVGMRIWGVTFALPDSEAGRVFRAGARVVIILILAAAAAELTNLGARLLTARIARRKGDRRRLAKLRTVTPLISGLANAAIVFAATAMILAEAGVEIGPLLAGAGVVGIAIGFGAQSLVKDLFTGMFLILEDIVSHGDIVEIQGVSGVVEAMTLRTIRLRAFDGVLHIFPYGEAQVIHNKTAAFSYFAFDVQISYLSSIEDAMKAIKAAGEDLQANEEVSRCVLAPVDVKGVDKLSDNGVVIKGRIRTLAGEQAKVGPVFLQLMKERLDEAGVMIAHRHLPIPTFDTIKDLAVSGDGHGPQPARSDPPRPFGH